MHRHRVSRPVVKLIGCFYIVMGTIAIGMGGSTIQSFLVVLGLVAIAGGCGVLIDKRWSVLLVIPASATVASIWLYDTASDIWSEGLGAPRLILISGFMIIGGASGCSYLLLKHFETSDDVT